jgi:hypothetical protein
MVSMQNGQTAQIDGTAECVAASSTLPDWALTPLGLSGEATRDRERFHELIAAVLWSIALHESERQEQAA